MKQAFQVLIVMGLLWTPVSPSIAGGIINKSNLSADYFRSLTRHASTDAADIIAYNPAGVMKMENGFYTKLDLAYVVKTYGNNVPASFSVPGASGDLETDSPSVIPGFFALYKQNKWAGFLAITVPGGGGEVEFDNGNSRTSVLGAGIIARSGGAFTGIDDMALEGNSVDLGFTLGGAWEINKTISVAGGLRYVDAEQEFKGYVDLTTGLPIPDRFEMSCSAIKDYDNAR